MEVALAHQHDTWRKRRHDRPDDFRAWLLKRLGEDTDAELERCSACEGDSEAVIREIDVVRRTAPPHREDDVNRLGKNLVVVEIENPDCFRIRGESARAHAHDEAALRQMV